MRRPSLNLTQDIFARQRFCDFNNLRNLQLMSFCAPAPLTFSISCEIIFELWRVFRLMISITLTLSMFLTPDVSAVRCQSSADYCAWAMFDLDTHCGYVTESYGIQMIPL